LTKERDHEHEEQGQEIGQDHQAKRMRLMEERTWATVAYAVLVGLYTIGRSMVKAARATPGVPGKPWYQRTELWLAVPLALEAGVQAIQAILGTGTPSP
jgi:hypothetical protein